MDTRLGMVLAAIYALGGVEPALAQPYARLCYDVSGATFCQNVTSATPLPVTTVPPAGAAIVGNAVGTTGAVVGTLAAVATKTTYICGFSVSAIGTGPIGPITIAGPTTSLIFQLTAVATGSVLTQSFTPCIPASAVNTTITTTTTADGTASNVAVNSWGYQQ